MRSGDLLALHTSGMKATAAMLMAAVAVAAAMAAPPAAKDAGEDSYSAEDVEAQEARLPLVRAELEERPPGAAGYAPRAPAQAVGPRYKTRDHRGQDVQPVVRTHVSGREPSRGRCPYGQKMDALNICRDIWD